MGEFVEQYYWTVYAADFVFRSACYVTFGALLVVIARRLKPRNPNPRPNCRCREKGNKVAGPLHCGANSDPPKASE